MRDVCCHRLGIVKGQKHKSVHVRLCTTKRRRAADEIVEGMTRHRRDNQHYKTVNIVVEYHQKSGREEGTNDSEIRFSTVAVKDGI